MLLRPPQPETPVEALCPSPQALPRDGREVSHCRLGAQGEGCVTGCLSGTLPVPGAVSGRQPGHIVCSREQGCTRWLSSGLLGTAGAFLGQNSFPTLAWSRLGLWKWSELREPSWSHSITPRAGPPGCLCFPSAAASGVWWELLHVCSFGHHVAMCQELHPTLRVTDLCFPSTPRGCRGTPCSNTHEPFAPRTPAAYA